MTRRLRAPIVRLAATALVFASIGCRSDSKPAARPSNGEKVLVIGVDGVEWNVVLPLIKRGRMPNLEALMQRGAFGKLATLAPAKSPVIWTTIATGKSPDKHGILDFFKRGPAGRLISYASFDRKTKALWNILTDYDRASVTIGWWATFPVEPVRGVLVAQTNTLDDFRKHGLIKGLLVRGIEGQVFPSARQNEMLEMVDQVDHELPNLLRDCFGDVGPSDSEMNRKSWEACSWALRADEAYRRMALTIADEKPRADLFAVYFGLTDVVGHRFWRFHEPAAFEHPPSAADVRLFGRVVNDAYARADRTIGDIVAKFPPETTVFVMSDHGMHAENTADPFNPPPGTLLIESGAHRDGPPGLFVAVGPHIQPTKPAKPLRDLTKNDLPDVGSVTDIAPTILALLGLPVGRDMDGRVLANLWKPEFAEKFDVDFVPTHDSPEWLAARGAELTGPASAERVKQLRDLGYLGKGDEKSK